MLGERSPWRHSKGKNVVIAGDLNDNAIWDRDYPFSSATQESLMAFGRITTSHGVYADFACGRYGKELQKSLCFLKNRSTRYHMDYILLPEAWTDRVTAVSVGDHGEWLAWRSCHCWSRWMTKGSTSMKPRSDQRKALIQL